MASFYVTSAAELKDALAQATGGDTIKLAAGDYGRLQLDSKTDFNTQYSSAVTITSDDPDDPASFSSMKLGQVSNITFDGILFDYDFSAGDTKYTRTFEITKSDNVTIKNSVFLGDVNADDDLGTAQGLNVSGSSSITLENNEFSTWHRALIVTDSSDLTVTGNDVHSCRSDGMDFAAVQNLLLEGNYIHDFLGTDDPGDHRDFIQFWTNGTDVPSTDVTIRGNVLDMGDGSWAQSIFIRNEEVDNGRAGAEMYYQNFLIEDNYISSMHLHGITVGETDGLIVRNNTLIAAEANPDDGANAALMDRYGTGSEIRVPTIRINEVSENVVIEGNEFFGAPDYNRERLYAYDGQSDWVVSNNVITPEDPGPDAPVLDAGPGADGVTVSPDPVSDPDATAGSDAASDPATTPDAVTTPDPDTTTDPDATTEDEASADPDSSSGSVVATAPVVVQAPTVSGDYVLDIAALAGTTALQG
ncbi:MAG: right-handed parallel beta-helix repeat-containing protein, partial [Rhodobacteraceae bacterium]|nr:right-handed parallel beta-helix repeat-containing protein [Paracoccaceae bacterium]